MLHSISESTIFYKKIACIKNSTRPVKELGKVSTGILKFNKVEENIALKFKYLRKKIISFTLFI